MRRSLLVLSCLGLAAIVPAQQRWMVAALDGSNEVPAVTSSGTGFALIRGDDTTHVVDIFLHTTNLASGIAAHLHQAPAGMNGGVIVPLAQTSPQTWTAFGASLTNTQYADLMAGNTYVNVHTPTNPGGEIRGQVVVATSSAFTAALDGSQETPPVTTSATGIAIGYLHEPDNVLTYAVTTSGLTNVIAAHIHTGPVGMAGPVLVPLNGSNGTYCGLTQLTAAQVATLKSGGLYVNVHTAANPAGEIRGQLTALGGAQAMSASLDGSQEVPPVTTNAKGNACLTLNGDGTVSYVLVTQGLVNGLIAHVHKGAPGVNGGVVFGLSGGPTVWQGTSPVLTSAQIQDALSGQWYVNAHTAANPGGEIRGQVHLVALPSTFGRGCPSSNGMRPEIGGDRLPCPGAKYTLTLHGGPTSQPAAFLFGVQRRMPPIDLAVINAPGCFVYHDDIGISFAAGTDALGCASVPLTLPLSLNLVGLTFYNQVAALDPGAPGSLVTSNALSSTIE